MKPIILSFLFICWLFLNSCQKKIDCPTCTTNKPPVANAGPDQIITLPKDSTFLDGSNSSDPDGSIIFYSWMKISGPSSFNIIKNDSVKIFVKGMVAGVYQFELNVTDNKGASAKDTVRVTVDAVPTSNHPPVACAGSDQVITLPANTVILNAGCSSDPDNNITGYLWTKISGPSSFSISNPTAAITQGTNLTQGIYQFELKVTDAGGLISKDTIAVSVNAAVIVTCNDSNRARTNLQLTEIGRLSQARTYMSVAAAGNKIVFAGGMYRDGSGGLGEAYGHSGKADIFDISTQTVTPAQLSLARTSSAAIACSNKIFFAGGEWGDGTAPVKNVDIYDVTNNTWTTDMLSTAGSGIAAATVGNKVFFAGGEQGFTPGLPRDQTVDIYDLSAATWSRISLSEGITIGRSALTAGNKIYFAGGQSGNVPTDRIEIYDNTTNVWSVASLQERKMFMAGIVFNDKIYWAGGSTGTGQSCLVEVKNFVTGSSSTQYLFSPAGGPDAVIKDNKILFFQYRTSASLKEIDIYDPIANTWSIGILPFNIEGPAVIAVNNTVYMAGGIVNGVYSDKIWKLEF